MPSPRNTKKYHRAQLKMAMSAFEEGMEMAKKGLNGKEPCKDKSGDTTVILTESIRRAMGKEIEEFELGELNG